MTFALITAGKPGGPPQGPMPMGGPMPGGPMPLMGPPGGPMGMMPGKWSHIHCIYKKKIGNLGNKSLVSHGKSACMVLYAEMHLRKYDQFNNLISNT